MNTHEKITSLLITQLTETQSALSGLIEVQDINQSCKTIFPAYRSAVVDQGFRLSEVGLQLMKSFFKCYNIAMPVSYVVTLPHILYMDRINSLPYFCHDRYCQLFDSELAMMLTLSEGSIQNLIETRFRLAGNGNSLNCR